MSENVLVTGGAGYIGSHMAIRKGQAFVRAVFLVIVLALIARQAWQLAAT